MHLVTTAVHKDGTRNVVSSKQCEFHPLNGDVIDVRLPVRTQGEQAWLVSLHEKEPDRYAMEHGRFPNSAAFRKFCAAKGWNEARDGSAWVWAHKYLRSMAGVIEVTCESVTYPKGARDKMREWVASLAGSGWVQVGQVHDESHFVKTGDAACQRELDARAKRIEELEADQSKTVEVLKNAGLIGGPPSQQVEFLVKSRNDERKRVQELDRALRARSERSIVDHVTGYGDAYRAAVGQSVCSAQMAALAEENHRLKSYIATRPVGITVEFPDVTMASLGMRAMKAETQLRAWEAADDVIFAKIARLLKLNPDLDECTWDTVETALRAGMDRFTINCQYDHDLGVLWGAVGRLLDANGIHNASGLRDAKMTALVLDDLTKMGDLRGKAIDAVQENVRRYRDLSSALRSKDSTRPFNELVLEVDTLRQCMATRWAEEDRRKVLALVGAEDPVNVAIAVKQYVDHANGARLGIWTALGRVFDSEKCDPTWNQVREEAVNIRRKAAAEMDLNVRMSKELAGERTKLRMLLNFFGTINGSILESFINDVCHNYIEEVRTEERHGVRTWQLVFRA